MPCIGGIRAITDVRTSLDQDAGSVRESPGRTDFDAASRSGSTPVSRKRWNSAGASRASEIVLVSWSLRLLVLESVLIQVDRCLAVSRAEPVRPAVG